MSKTLTFSAVVEMATGFALMIAPAFVVALLLGATPSDAEMPLARLMGIALLALGMACWPSRQNVGIRSSPFRAMLCYNVLIALYLAYLGIAVHLAGPLLWPAIALHVVVALLLIWTWRNERVTNRPTPAG